MAKKVIILGGGVGGLSAAHELVERGFEVEIYERQKIPGGKARSIPVYESINDHGSKSVHGRAIKKWLEIEGYRLPPHAKRPWLPGEHGFRFFPSFYKHIIDTMERIPYGKGKVSDNLVNTSQVMFARYDLDNAILPSRFPRTPDGITNVLDFFQKLFTGGAGVPLDEIEFFAARVWQIMTSCEDRRQGEYEKIGWWDFVGAGDHSQAYQNFFAHGFTRSLVASQAQLASAYTVGNMHLQLLFDIANPTIPTSDRLLNGPSNVVWIRPWVNYLQARGVKYVLDAEVQSITYSQGQITSVIVGRNGLTTEVTGDYFISALPIERIAPLLTQEIVKADPQLGHIEELSKHIEWMNGIQFYLTRPLPIAHGHVLYLDTEWALTSVSQAQFWPDFDLSQFSDGDTKEILSVDISDWNRKGMNNKTAKECDREEIALEVWNEIKRSLNTGGPDDLKDEDLDYWFLDSDIQRSSSEKYINVEPLLVNLKDTLRLRPNAVTRIPNFFLASDYVRTHTDLATMEAANEAARQAVNGIIEASGSNATLCRVWKLHEPDIFQPMREYDRRRWQSGLPWDDSIISIGLSFLDIIQRMAGLTNDEIGYYPTGTGKPDHLSQAKNLGEADQLLKISQQILAMVGSDTGRNILSPGNPSETSGAPDLPKPNSDSQTLISSPSKPSRVRISQKES